MVISEQAIWVLESSGERWLRRLFGRWRGQARDSATIEAPGSLLPSSVEIFAADGSRAHGPALVRTGEDAADDLAMADGATDAGEGSPLSPAERRARALTVSALMRVRDGRFDLARDLFADAASLDPGLDLSLVPGFWGLPRAGQQAAVEGYEVAGRVAEAELLVANLRYRFRPKLVRRQPQSLAEAPISPR